MRNLKSAQVVNVGNLFNPEREGYLGLDLPLVQKKKQPQVYRKVKEASKRLRLVNVRGRIKLALSVMYFITLVYFLTLLLT